MFHRRHPIITCQVVILRAQMLLFPDRHFRCTKRRGPAQSHRQAFALPGWGTIAEHAPAATGRQLLAQQASDPELAPAAPTVSSVLDRSGTQPEHGTVDEVATPPVRRPRGLLTGLTPRVVGDPVGAYALAAFAEAPEQPVALAPPRAFASSGAAGHGRSPNRAPQRGVRAAPARAVELTPQPVVGPVEADVCAAASSEPGTGTDADTDTDTDADTDTDTEEETAGLLAHDTTSSRGDSKLTRAHSPGGLAVAGGLDVTLDSSDDDNTMSVSIEEAKAYVGLPCAAFH